MMRYRPHLVGAAMGLFAWAAIASTPAAATPCTNLQSSLNLPDTIITSATDNTTGVFVVPGSGPITGLPAFCRVIATLIPTSDSNIKIEVWLPETTWNGRFLGTGGGGFQGIISYSALASGIQQASLRPTVILAPVHPDVVRCIAARTATWATRLRLRSAIRPRPLRVCSGTPSESRISATGRSI